MKTCFNSIIGMALFAIGMIAMPGMTVAADYGGFGGIIGDPYEGDVVAYADTNVEYDLIDINGLTILAAATGGTGRMPVAMNTLKDECGSAFAVAWKPIIVTFEVGWRIAAT